MNPAHWPWWWDVLCGAVAGFVVGCVVTTRIAVTAIRNMGANRRNAEAGARVESKP